MTGPMDALVAEVTALLANAPGVQGVLSLGTFDDFPGMAGALFTAITATPALGALVAATYRADPDLSAMTLYDIAETARRNFEPGGAAATFLFARGAQAVMAHRVAHAIWKGRARDLALALKSVTGRALGTDIHPAAQIGAGFWLDHGLGFVAGETAIIAEDVSIWHGVTLGSTLNDSGPRRHPEIGKGAVIGAGATLLGGITIGPGANIGAGAIVVEDVPAGTLMAGPKAQARGAARISFAPDARGKNPP